MKKLLFGLGALFLATAAHAQPQPKLEPVTPPGDKIPLLLPNLSAVTGLEAVVETQVFTLKRGRYDSKDLMETLAAKVGGKAIFVKNFQPAPINIIVPLRGTAPELIKRMADYGVAGGQIGVDWVFVPVQNRFPQGVPLFRSAPNHSLRIWPDANSFATKPFPFALNPAPEYYFLRILPEIKPFAVKPFDFNLIPKPGENLPPNATQFGFNGDRLYPMPITPHQP